MKKTYKNTPSETLNAAYAAYVANPTKEEANFFESVKLFASQHYTQIRDEDAIQEAVIQVWQDLPTFRGEGAKFSSWATKVIGNKLQYEARKLRLRELRETSYDVLVEGDSAEDSFGPATDLSVEEVQVVESAIKQLSPTQLEVVSLKRKGLTNAEISAKLGVAASTVHERWESALKRLQRGST